MKESQRSIVVSGQWACFTSPEAKVERLSYDVMTWTAAKGLLESIYWKPEMFYEIEHLYVLKEGVRTSMRTNEIKSKIRCNISSARTQRKNQMLYDVSYRLDFSIKAKSGLNTETLKHVAIFDRRMDRGEYFSKPCLGLSELVADVRWSRAEDIPIPVSKDLGPMLMRIDFLGEKPQAVFARARLINGELVYLP